MATPRRSSNMVQNLAVGTISPLPGAAGVFINGSTNSGGAINGVTILPDAPGMVHNDPQYSFTLTKGGPPASVIALSYDELAMGNDTTATGEFAIALGVSVSAAGQDSVAVGRELSATGLASVCVGYSCAAVNSNACAFGVNNFAGGVWSTVLGSESYVGANYAASLGQHNVVSDAHTNSVLIGGQANSFAANVASIGSNTIPLRMHETKDGHKFKFTVGFVTANPSVADLSGGILTYAVAAPITMTLPSALSFVADIGEPTLAGTGVRCTIINNSASAITLSAGGDPDWTLFNSTSDIIAANTTRELFIVKTSAPGAVTLTCTCYM